MHTQVAIVGGGVVGMACAAALARRGSQVVVLEKHDRAGQEISSRNSEVVHAGLYYPPASLKARSCVRGRELLYERCERLDIPHRRTGKLVVATDAEQLPALHALQERGKANGAGALRWLDAQQAQALEPDIRCVAALLSPETGIVDSHALVESYRREAVDHGADVVFRTEVVHVARRDGSWQLLCKSGGGVSERLGCDWVINAAGLESDAMAAMCGVNVAARELTLHPCKGDYFSLHPRLWRRVSRLIYPLPDAAGLGIHLTLDLSGALRAGPDAHFVDRPTYQVDAEARGRFLCAVRRYFPLLQANDLEPDYAGVRPKLARPGEGFRDFELLEPAEAPRSLHLIGIESPGLTAAGALAELVVDRVYAA